MVHSIQLEDEQMLEPSPIYLKMHLKYKIQLQYVFRTHIHISDVFGLCHNEDVYHKFHQCVFRCTRPRWERRQSFPYMNTWLVQYKLKKMTTCVYDQRLQVNLN